MVRDDITVIWRYSIIQWGKRIMWVIAEEGATEANTDR